MSITFNEVQALFGKSNANLVREFLVNHLLQDYSKEEIFEMVLGFNEQTEEDASIDEINSEIAALDPEDSLEIAFEGQTPDLLAQLDESGFADGNWIEVESTAVNAVRLIGDASVLDIQYKNSADNLFYRYYDVPQDIFNELISVKNTGGSVGKFLSLNVRYAFEHNVMNKQEVFA